MKLLSIFLIFFVVAAAMADPLVLRDRIVDSYLPASRVKSSYERNVTTLNLRIRRR